MKPKFKKAVDNGDVVSARLFLANELMLDPRGDSFLQMLSYAESVFAESLYEADNGNSYSANECEWNEQLLFRIKNDLDDNFSKMRLSFYEKVVKVVLKDKAASLIEEASRPKPAINVTRGKRTRTSSKTVVYGGVTAGGAVLAVAGIAAEAVAAKVALTALGITGIVVGGVLLYKELSK